ncbi:MAG TPA: response regulator [Chthoniobacterales bacterium]
MKTRALIVDDDPNLSRLAGVILETTNLYEVRIESQAMRALTAAREFKPHIVLLDVDMPGRDGGEVANDIRADPALSQTRILFLTGLVSKDEAGDSALVSGGSHFLAKPIEPAVLLQTVARLLQDP